jgi:hypothetical protein
MQPYVSSMERRMSGARIVLWAAAAVLATTVVLIALNLSGGHRAAVAESPAASAPGAGPRQPMSSSPVAVAPTPGGPAAPTAKPVAAPDGAVAPVPRSIIGPAGPVPPGALVALPPEAQQGVPPVVRAAPLGQTEVRDHRGEPPSAPPRSFTTAGLDAARQVLAPIAARCVSGRPAVTLRFTLENAGGRARAREAQLLEGTQLPEAQACLTQALADVSWPTADGDGADPVVLPLRLR